MTCPKCKAPMMNHGNLSGTMLMTMPPQWRDTYACHLCRVKTVVLVRGTNHGAKPDLTGYEDLTP